MPKLTIIITEKITASMRGELTRWMLEVKTGVFIGTLSALVREKLWEFIKNKVRGNGAWMIYPARNEQRYQILTCGHLQREVVDHEGLQLIRKPQKTKLQVNMKSTHADTEKKAVTGKSIEENSMNNIICRKIEINKGHGEINYNYSASSSFKAITVEDVWLDEWKVDIEKIWKRIVEKVDHLVKNKKDTGIPLKIVSIDIETTNYILKAYEGFVNIIGISVVDFNEVSEFPSLYSFQVFNMLRKKEGAAKLVEIVYPMIQDASVLIVFNKEFDIQIIKSIISRFKLGYRICDNVLDYKKDFFNLKELEQKLYEETTFKRIQTKKGCYNDYYSKFKGKMKLIDPIGAYNLMDTLTPLLYYLQEESVGRNQEDKNDF